MNELISMQKRDGSKGKLRIIEWITAHTLTQCVDFAHMLLVDPLLVKQLRKKHKDRKEEFVRAVFQKWLGRDDDDESEESLPCTWDALVKCCEDANLDGIFVTLLRGNIPKFGRYMYMYNRFNLFTIVNMYMYVLALLYIIGSVIRYCHICQT